MSKLHYNLTLNFMDSEPVAAARKLELVDPQLAAQIIKDAPIDTAIKVLKSMMANIAAKLLAYFSEEQCRKLTESMEITDLTAILRHVESGTRKSTIGLLSKRKQALCKMLISYPEYAIGSMIDSDVLTADNQMKVQEVLARLKTREYSFLQWLYIIDQNRSLQGVVFIGDMLKADNKIKVGSLAKDKVETVSASTDLVTAMEWGLWEHSDAVAVTNNQKEFIGVLHYSKLRHNVSIKQERDTQTDSVSADFLEVYADIIVNMVELIQPVNSLTHSPPKR